MSTDINSATASSSATDGGAYKFRDSSEILRRFEAALKGRPADEASIVICEPGGVRRFSADKFGAVAEVSGEDKLYVPASCMAKLYTPTVAMERFAARGISIDQSVGDMARDLFGITNEKLSAMTLRHLFNSSHGLDDISIDRYPVTSDGFLDFAGQVQRFTAPQTLTDPGRCFSLNDVGMLMIGAILEKLEDRKFGDIVMTHLLAKLAAESNVPARQAIDGRCCPTTGRGLTNSARELLSLAEHFFVCDGHKNPNASALLATMKTNPTSFPGWTGMGTSVGLGWHEYFGNWWGYNGEITGGGTQLLRMRPEQGLAIAIISKKVAAHYLAIGLFGDALPEARLVRPPKSLEPQAAEQVAAHPEDMVGRYEVAAIAAEIPPPTAEGFEVRITKRFENGIWPKTPVVRKLRLTEGRGFFTSPIETNFLAYGQIVDIDGESGRRRYLWNGRRLWTKATQ